MRVLITGVGGQDGRYLARALVAAGHEVHGIAQRPTSHAFLNGVTVHVMNITQAREIHALVAAIKAQACYHLAAQHRSSAQDEAEDHDGVMRTNVDGAEIVLGATRQHAPECRVVMASSCQVFGAPTVPLQNEETPRAPRNAYALSKVMVEQLADYYQRVLGLFVSTAILFNHESPLRSPRFVSAKIALAAALAARGERAPLKLGTLLGEVDWMHAADAVAALRAILSANAPGVFVVGSGNLRTTREMAEVAFGYVGLPWRDHVVEDPTLVRPASGLPYAADASRIRQVTGWRPRVSFESMVRELVEHHRGGTP
jgi:GDPmannose 4,6-dehydratase